jgi:hypothetical protein
MPNPDPQRLFIKSSLPIQKLVLSVYSPAMVHLARTELPLIGSGQMQTSLPPEILSALPTGLCYLQIEALGPVGPVGKHQTLRVMTLR